MAHTIYDNFYLSNEVEDQFNSHLDLQQFCTVDNSLVGTAGMKRKINVYKATAGTEKLKMGEGNTTSIEVSFTPEEYEIQLAQNKFQYYDEQEMTDPMLVPVGTRHMGTDLFNTVNGDVYDEFKKATMVVPTAKIDFAAFVDAVANLNIESTISRRRLLRRLSLSYTRAILPSFVRTSQKTSSMWKRSLVLATSVLLAA